MGRSAFGLLGLLLVVAFILYLMTPHEPGSTGQKIRETVKQEITETSDRLDKAFDAAKRDLERIEANGIHPDNRRAP